MRANNGQDFAFLIGLNVAGAINAVFQAAQRMGPGTGYVTLSNDQGERVVVFSASFGRSSPPYGGVAGIFAGTMAPGSTLGTLFVPGWFTPSGKPPGSFGGFLPKEPQQPKKKH